MEELLRKKRPAVTAKEEWNGEGAISTARSAGVSAREFRPHPAVRPVHGAGTPCKLAVEDGCDASAGSSGKVRPLPCGTRLGKGFFVTRVRCRLYSRSLDDPIV